MKIEKGTKLHILLFDEPAIVSNIGHDKPAIDLVPISRHASNTKPQYKVYSPFDGTVVNVGYDPTSGNFIAIKKSNGVRFFFCHFANSLTSRFKIGDKVRRGQYLAIMGNSGHSFGEHVHVQATKDGKRISMSDIVSEMKSSSNGMTTTIWILIGVFFVAGAVILFGKRKHSRRRIK